eukprot:2744933-Pleurochrysis_carterae.AAC.1
MVRRSCDLLAAPSENLGGSICKFESARWKSEALAPYSGGVQNDGASTVYCVGCRACGDVAARSSASSPCLPSAL